MIPVAIAKVWVFAAVAKTICWKSGQNVTADSRGLRDCKMRLDRFQRQCFREHWVVERAVEPRSLFSRCSEIEDAKPPQPVQTIPDCDRLEHSSQTPDHVLKFCCCATL
jgi:hypothetical protein